MKGAFGGGNGNEGRWRVILRKNMRLLKPSVQMWVSLLALAAGSLLAGCRQGQDAACRPDPAAASPAAPLHLAHLERPFFELKTPAQALQFMQANPTFARFYLQAGQVVPDSLADGLTRLSTNPALQKLNQQTATAFADSAALRQDLAAMLGRVKYYFPDFQVPRAATFVSGFQGKDLFVNDSLLVISLDWFAGPKASYRPDLPNYMLRRYRPPFVLPAVAFAIASKYNKHQLTATSMLDQMVDQGKRLYFAGQMLPCASDTLLLGYTGKELRAVQGNEGRVWGHFLENNLLFATEPFQIQKYVGERPNVPEIDRTAPGRIGQWVGLQIIRKYMAEHPNKTLPQLMAESNAQKILDESHYRPKK